MFFSAGWLGRVARVLLVAMCICGGSMWAAGQPTGKANSALTTAIAAVLNRSAEDWNRGDLDAFAQSYKNSPDIVFVGRKNSYGFAAMLERYKKDFPTPAALGRLSFSSLEAQPLDQKFATATGHFHLERTAEGGGPLDGHFLLVMEKTGQGWKIVRDATTAEQGAPAH